MEKWNFDWRNEIRTFESYLGCNIDNSTHDYGEYLIYDQAEGGYLGDILNYGQPTLTSLQEAKQHIRLYDLAKHIRDMAPSVNEGEEREFFDMSMKEAGFSSTDPDHEKTSKAVIDILKEWLDVSVLK